MIICSCNVLACGNVGASPIACDAQNFITTYLARMAAQGTPVPVPAGACHIQAAQKAFLAEKYGARCANFTACGGAMLNEIAIILRGGHCHGPASSTRQQQEASHVHHAPAL